MLLNALRVLGLMTKPCSSLLAGEKNSDMAKKMTCAKHYTALQLEFILIALQGLVYTKKTLSVYLNQ